MKITTGAQKSSETYLLALPSVGQQQSFVDYVKGQEGNTEL